ncbi:GID complex subunit 4, VID24 [Linnemannia zychae]|nr:GID complex subunit 4, VID24 [Linnemannia zychae]
MQGPAFRGSNDLGATAMMSSSRSRGLTEEYPELTTYFEAEIIGPKYSFFTRKWDADELVDEEHWTLFRPFECLSSSVFYGRDKHVDKGEGICIHTHASRLALIPHPTSSQMAHHHASPYHDVENVRMIASPLFKVPSPISPPYDMHPLPEDVIQRRYHDFSLEHRIVQEYQRIMAEEAAAIEAKESAFKLYADERQARLKQERITMARKIAPGFLDNDDRRILTPTLATAQVKEQTSSSAQQANTLKYAGNRFDYSEFEARDPVDEGPSNFDKDDGPSVKKQSSLQGENLPEEIVSPTQDRAEGESNDGSEEEVIVQAVPLSELTGLLRDSCLEEESSSSAPRTWHERDPASEKSTMPSFNATRLDFREFEQGLGPPDPWDTPVDDLTALKDVISQQLGHSSSAMQQDSPLSSSRPQQPHHMQSQQPQHSLSQTAYPYQQHQLQQQPAPTQQYHQPSEHSAHSHYPYPAANTPSRTAYNSSPVPVASFVPPTKLTGIAQQQAALQHHQQQHRHSTGGIGAHGATGLTPSQQHARFGNASPSPPPLPPPPRAMTTSPSVHSSTVTATSGVSTTGANRPRLPARPLRPNDPSSTDSLSAGLDHATAIDRSMTPPRPPLPPPPHISSQGTTSSASAIVSGSLGGMPPALKPRPPKDHEVLHGMIASNQKTMQTGVHGGFTEPDGRGGQDLDDSQQQQQVAPAPPQADSLISQLASMGFTREQSRGALEKYDYDLEKATNHLLDWDE